MLNTGVSVTQTQHSTQDFARWFLEKDADTELHVAMSVPRIRFTACADFSSPLGSVQVRTYCFSSVSLLPWNYILPKTRLRVFIYFLEPRMLSVIGRSNILNYLKYFVNEISCLKYGLS